MGETDEIVPQSSHAEDETVQEPVTEESVTPVAAEQAEPADAAEKTETAAPDDPDEISESLSDDESATPESLDDIAPATPEVAPVAQLPEPAVIAGQVPWWPFLVYLGAWIVLAAAAVWQLLQLPADQVVYESQAYVMTILGGLIMTAVGPVLILAVWLGTRVNRSARDREGLLTSALMKGAFVTLSGAIIWWASLVIIDYLRLGRLL